MAVAEVVNLSYSWVRRSSQTVSVCVCYVSLVSSSKLDRRVFLRPLLRTAWCHCLRSTQKQHNKSQKLPSIRPVAWAFVDTLIGF